MHDAGNQLPHDIVVVDEMSMVSLTLMTRLLEAVRPTARLILVGDPDQLSSVEAGAVLADIARAPGPPDERLGEQLVQLGVAPVEEPAPVHGVVQLSHTWRYGGAIDALARAIRASDPDQALAVLRSDSADVQFTEIDLDDDPDLAVAAEVSGLADAVRRTGPANPGRRPVRRRPGRLDRVGHPPAALRPPPRTVRGGPLEPGGGALAGRGHSGLRRGWRVVRRPTAAGDRQ